MIVPAFASRKRVFVPGLRQTFGALLFLLSSLTGANAEQRNSQDLSPASTEVAEAKPSPTGPAANDDKVVEQQGVASWYGRAWRGRRTASGQRFDERLLTAASLSLPLATRAQVTNLENGRSIEVLVNDRGPYKNGRIMDLSAAAAAALGMRQSGLAPVAIRAPLLAAEPAG